FPGWRETKTQGEYLFGKHGNPPEGGLSKLGEVGQFHIKRRRTTKTGPPLGSPATLFYLPVLSSYPTRIRAIHP
ncbi:hypothetical protein, partial [Nitratidesulfovibrio oxamicus]|uniref:hypothetical protein n=1 Tax=Nitratidesulfovibrio oxamicus TaxID=32016 RepID=UPI001E5C0EBB